MTLFDTYMQRTFDSMRPCDNCEREDRPTDTYFLEIDTVTDGPRELELALCDRCASEFLTEEWIEEKDAGPAR